MNSLCQYWLTETSHVTLLTYWTSATSVISSTQYYSTWLFAFSAPFPCRLTPFIPLPPPFPFHALHPLSLSVTFPFSSLEGIGWLWLVKWSKSIIAVCNYVALLPWELPCHTGSHSVTGVTFPHLPQQSLYSILQHQRDARLSWPSWLVTYRDGVPTQRRSPIPAGLDVG